MIKVQLKTADDWNDETVYLPAVPTRSDIVRVGACRYRVASVEFDAGFELVTLILERV